MPKTDIMVVSNHWDGLWTGLLDCTGLLDLICSYHMTSTQSVVLNLVALTALCYYKLCFIFPLQASECTLQASVSAHCTSYMDGYVP